MERSLRVDPFHADQFGFRRKKTTIDALGRVRGIADLRKIAFNTLRWRKIMQAIKDRLLPIQLQILLNDYLSRRKIFAYCGNGVVRMNVYAGVPQGSIVGPLL
jgi:hypothetical protein